MREGVGPPVELGEAERAALVDPTRTSRSGRTGAKTPDSARVRAVRRWSLSAMR